MSPWQRSILFVLAREGGYVSDPADPGGETNMGITKRDFPNEDIKNLTRERVTEIYQSEYWSNYGPQKSFCDHLPWPLNMVHFDCTVNIGNLKRGPDGAPIWTGRANKILQRALAVTDDGIIGPHTLAVAGRTNLEDAMRAIEERRRYYRDLVVARPDLAKFQNGWLHRCEQLENAIINPL